MKSILLAMMLAASLIASGQGAWTEASRLAVAEMTKKYGPPDLQGTNLAIWRDKGIWRSIEISAGEEVHNFPIAHTDVLMQCVSYAVPADKMNDLATFSGSITADRTRGLLCARCDSEANNTLSLNLAHEVVTGFKTPEDARKAFGNIVRQKMNGAKTPYMEKLNFQPSASAGQPDQNTTGLTRQDVIKISRKIAVK